jgi:hypothetical protein
MKYFLLSIASLLFLTFPSKGFSEPITIKIEFDVEENITSLQGVFSVAETNQTFVVESDEGFSLKLPKAGRYNFYFKADGYLSYLNFPQRITNKNNIIVIKLKQYPVISVSEYTLYKALTENEQYSNKQLDSLSKSNNLRFIVHGLNNSLTKKMAQFTKKYRVGFSFENCTIDPMSFDRASYNNKVIHDFLNYKFGSSWKSELPIKPIGFKI